MQGTAGLASPCMTRTRAARYGPIQLAGTLTAIRSAVGCRDVVGRGSGRGPSDRSTGSRRVWRPVAPATRARDDGALTALENPGNGRFLGVHMMLEHREGGCHCGRVRFRAGVDLDLLSHCNCTVCTMKGILHLTVVLEDLELIRVKISLTV